MRYSQLAPLYPVREAFQTRRDGQIALKQATMKVVEAGVKKAHEKRYR